MNIRIIAKTEGFRRGGIAHSRTPQEHDSDAFSDEQLAQILSEPLLDIEVLDGAEGEDGKGKGKKKGKGKGKKKGKG